MTIVKKYFYKSTSAWTTHGLPEVDFGCLVPASLRNHLYNGPQPQLGPCSFLVVLWFVIDTKDSPQETKPRVIIGTDTPLDRQPRLQLSPPPPSLSLSLSLAE